MVQFGILHGSIMYLKNIAFEPALIVRYVAMSLCVHILKHFKNLSLH